MLGEVVPNGEVLVVVLPAAGAAEPPFAPESEDVAMSKMPLLPDGCAEEDEVFVPLLELPPVRFWAASGRVARQRQASAKQAFRFIGFMHRFLSGLRFSSSGRCGRIVIYKVITENRKSKPDSGKNLNSGKKRVD